MRYTQQILGRNKPALEAEEPVVDQTVIDSLPVEDETQTPEEAAAPVDDTVAEVTEPTDPVEPAEPAEPVEDVVAAPVEEPGAGEITPPDAEGVEISPTTDSGEITVDQVSSVQEGDEPAAAAAVAEADTLAGEPTTPEEVIEQTEQVEEALGDDAGVTELPGEPGMPGADPVDDIATTPVEPPVEGGDAPVEGPEDVPGTDPVVPPEDVPAEAVPAEATSDDTALEDGATPTDPVEPPLPASPDASTEDCACEEGDLGQQDVVAQAPGEFDDVTGSGEGTAQTDGPVEGAGVVQDEEIDFSPAIITDETEGEVLDEALDTYPQVVEVLEGALDNGGISVEAMAILNIFTKRDGIPVGSNIAIESYNHTARTQTRVALEALKDNWKEWLQQFIDWLKKKAQDVLSFIKAQFDVADKVERAATQLLNVTDDGATKSGDVSGAFLGKIKVDSKVTGDYGREFSASVNTLVNYLSHFNKGIIDISSKALATMRADVLKVIVQGTAKDENDQDYTGRMEKVTKPAADEVVALLGRCGLKKSNDDFTYEGESLVGDNKLTVQFIGSSREESAAWDSIRVSRWSDDTTNAPESAPVLSNKAVKEIAKDLLRLVEGVKAAQKESKEYEELSAGIVSELERLTKLNDNTVGEKVSAQQGPLNGARKVIAGINTLASSSVLTTVSISMDIAVGTMQYLKASVAEKGEAVAQA